MVGFSSPSVSVRDILALPDNGLYDKFGLIQSLLMGRGHTEADAEARATAIMGAQGTAPDVASLGLQLGTGFGEPPPVTVTAPTDEGGGDFGAQPPPPPGPNYAALDALWAQRLLISAEALKTLALSLGLPASEYDAWRESNIRAEMDAPKPTVQGEVSERVQDLLRGNTFHAIMDSYSAHLRGEQGMGRAQAVNSLLALGFPQGGVDDMLRAKEEQPRNQPPTVLTPQNVQDLLALDDLTVDEALAELGLYYESQGSSSSRAEELSQQFLTQLGLDVTETGGLAELSAEAAEDDKLVELFLALQHIQTRHSRTPYTDFNTLREDVRREFFDFSPGGTSGGARFLAQQQADQWADELFYERDPVPKTALDDSMGGVAALGVGDIGGRDMTSFFRAPSATGLPTQTDPFRQFTEQRFGLTPGGRRDQFNAFAFGGASPFDFNPATRGVVAGQFPDISAQFQLQNILNPGAVQSSNFADFLRGGSLPFNRSAVPARFDELADLFTQGEVSNAQQAQLAALSDPAVAREMILANARGQVNPFLAPFAEDIAASRLATLQAGADISGESLFRRFLGATGRI